MKRNISVTLSLLLISFSILLLFTSCEKHVHTFGEWSTVLESTCSAEGRQERTCECGEKETQPIEALPHTADKWIKEIIATTMNKGVQSSNCTVCQAPLIRELPQRVTKYLTYTVNADGVTCTVTGRKYFDNETELGIPDEIDGYKVTAIGDYAFDNKLFGYSHLYIPEGVTHIGKGAFSGTPLKHAHLPNSLVYIGESALGFSTSGYYNLYNGGLYLGNEENPYVVLIAPYNYDVKTCAT